MDLFILQIMDPMVFGPRIRSASREQHLSI